MVNAEFQQFIVMFRSRFTEAFPKSLPNFGPQELERDVVDGVPGEGVEHLLCAILGLLLNRKQDVKYVPLHIPACAMRLCRIQLLTRYWEIGPVITIAHWKRLYRHTSHNGRRIGRARIPFLEAKLLLRCLLRSESVYTPPYFSPSEDCMFSQLLIVWPAHPPQNSHPMDSILVRHR
jgi:hypothetical protein